MYYLYHIEKTGGRSIIHSFLHSATKVNAVLKTNEKLSDLYMDLCSKRRNFNGKFFHAWQANIKNCKPNSFFGFSHLPCNKVTVPKGTYKITVIREPLERLLCHYRMLIRFKKENKGHGIESDNPVYVKDGFNSFIKTFPEKFMQHQLWFWSEKFNIKEAISNIKKCNIVILTENMPEGIREINKETGLKLRCFHAGLGDSKPVLTHEQIEILKNRLTKEYQFYNEANDS